FVPSPNLFKHPDLTFTQSSSQTTHQHPAPEHQQPTSQLFTLTSQQTSSSPIFQHTFETTVISVPIAHSRPNMMEINNDPVFNTPTRETTSAAQPTKHPPMADQETNIPEQFQTNPESNNQP
ncbi:44752_t:CDS:1, partial [Gigaspora margarita]